MKDWRICDMKRKILGRIISAVTAAAVMAAYQPVFANGGDDCLVNIMLDDCITNDTSEYIDVSGTSNTRIVEDGKNNKSLYADLSFVDSEITVLMPEYSATSQYSVQFDMRIEGACGGAIVSMTSKSGIKQEMFRIEEDGTIRAADDKRYIGGAVGKTMKTLTFSVDNEMNQYNCYFNGKEVVSKKSLPVSISDVERLVITANSPLDKSAFYADNFRIYNGIEYRDIKTKCKYNEMSMSFEDVDESDLAYKVYYKNDLDTASSLTFSYYPSGNTLEYREEGEGDKKNGFMQFGKTATTGIYTYQSLGKIGKHVVFEADVRHGKKSAGNMTFILIDGTSGSSRVITGPITVKETAVVGGGSSAALKRGKWNKISLAVNFTAHTFDLFVNGELCMKDKSLPESLATVSELRFSVESSASFGTLDMDNVHIYSGSEPRDISNTDVKYESRFNANDNALSYLKGKTAVQTYSSTIFESNKKSVLANKCINYGDESLIPQDAFEKLFKCKVSVSDNTVSIDGGVVMTIGSDVMKVSGRDVKLSNAPEMIDNIAYLPAVAYGNAVLGEGKFLNDDHGMLLVGSSLTKSDARNKMANIYLFFERKPETELKEQLAKNTDNLAEHPRLMMTKESAARLRNEVKTDPYKKKWFEVVRARADSYVEAEPLEYKVTSGRMLDLSATALSRMETLGFVYQMTLDKKYGDKTVKELEALTSFQDWGQQYSFLECATFASAAAIGFDWARDCMDDATAEKIAVKAQELGLKQANLAYTGAAPYNDFWWNTETNWGIITNGGISNLALATAEYNTDEAMTVLRDALRSMEFTWYRFAPDGAWHEGPGYWSYMFTHLSRFLSSYRTAMGEDFATNYRGLNKYGYFQCYFMGPDALPNNFHDADSYYIESSGQFILAEIYGDKELMRYRRDTMEKYGISPTSEDIIWYDASVSGDKSPVRLPNDAYYRETELVSMRENWEDTDASWLSYHGGELINAHDQIDAGTYVFTLGGVRWALDLGKEPLRYGSVTPATEAGYTIYDFYRARAEGHNCVVINPTEALEMNQSSFSKVEEPKYGANGAIGTVNLSDAYVANASSYMRGYKLSDSRRTFTLRDEIELLTDSEVYWFMHTEGKIRIIDNKTAVIYQDGKALKVQLETNAQNQELSVMDAVSLPTSPKFNMSANPGVTKLALKMKASGSLNITAKMSLIGESGSDTGVDTTPISQWDVNALSAGKKESASAARLDSLSIGGERLDSFSSDKFSYTYTKGKDGSIPEISAQSQSGTVTTENFKGLDGADMVLITVTGNDNKSAYYTIQFKEFSYESIDVYDKIPASAISASSEQIIPEDNVYNTKENTTDGDLATRWSAYGTRDWLVFDLGESKEIDAFGIAFWKATERHYIFDVLVSDDNLNYTKVMSVTTKEYTDDPVVYIPQNKVKARYVKYLGHGNTVNEWNNILEFMPLKSK